MSLAMGSVNLDRKKIHSFFFYSFQHLNHKTILKDSFYLKKWGYFYFLTLQIWICFDNFFLMKIEDICCASISRFV